MSRWREEDRHPVRPQTCEANNVAGQDLDANDDGMDKGTIEISEDRKDEDKGTTETFGDAKDEVKGTNETFEDADDVDEGAVVDGVEAKEELGDDEGFLPVQRGAKPARPTPSRVSMGDYLTNAFSALSDDIAEDAHGRARRERAPRGTAGGHQREEFPVLERALHVRAPRDPREDPHGPHRPTSSSTSTSFTSDTVAPGQRCPDVERVTFAKAPSCRCSGSAS